MPEQAEVSRLKSGVRWILDIPRTLCLLVIRAYQASAPIRPQMCRYRPTCSQYTADAIRTYGVFSGVALGIRRILRCNPISPGGYDPVPAIGRKRPAPPEPKIDLPPIEGTH
jgi:putative membrane protein insertion efficiency factor